MSLRVCTSLPKLKQNKNKGEEVILDFACGHCQPPFTLLVGILLVGIAYHLPIISYCQSITRFSCMSAELVGCPRLSMAWQ